MMAVLADLMESFTGKDRPAYCDDAFAVYMDACRAPYPAAKTATSFCLLMLLVKPVAQKESAITREFDAQHPAAGK
jgi:hypothetical protein